MRKLAIGASAFSCAVFCACYLIPLRLLPIFAIAAVISGTLSLLRRSKLLLAVRIALISAAFGFAVFAVHDARTVLPARELDGETMIINAVLTDYPSIYDNYCRAEVKLDGAVPHLRAILYDNSHQLENAVPGQSIRCTARLHAANTRYGEDNDYYNSRGVYLIASAKGEVDLGEVHSSPIYYPQIIRHRLLACISEIFPSDTAPFMRSVLLGEKSELYDSTRVYTDLTRSGFMHIAAVSGMHISFLVAFLQLFLGRGRKSAFICIALIWCFVLVTGAPPSAVRAGFMQSAFLFAPVVRRENDSVTTLSTVLALVLLENPHAAASVSLQLSFGAVAGIYLFYGEIHSALISLIHNEKLRKRVQNPMGVVACSLSVMAVTMPLLAVHFGYISILSPLMNVAALWAASLCFCGGLSACALSALWKGLGIAAAWLCSWAARYVFLVARLISSVPFSVLFFDSAIGYIWLALCYLFFVGAMFTRLSPVRRLLYPLILSALALVATFAAMRLDATNGRGTVTVLDVGQGQSLCVLSGRASVMIDCGGGATRADAGDTAGAYLLNRGHSTLDALVLTHLHDDHANGVEKLMELVDVRYLIMPDAPNDDDNLHAPILAAAAEHGTEVVYVARDMLLDADGIHVALYAPGKTGDTNERCIMCLVSLGEFDMLVTGDAPEKAERELVTTHEIHDTEVYIVGHHGSKYSSGDALLSSIGADTAIISVGYNSYGHPTQETLERLDAYGYNIYRTDIDGRVEIRVR